MRGLEEAGADVIELGLPFSDPMADGPVIQASSQRALELGMNFDRLLELVARANVGVPLVLFSYLNPILAAGDDALVRAAQAGMSGLLLTDLPVGADPEREARIGAGPLEFIRLVAPTTPLDAHARDRRARTWIRLPHQPTRRDRNARRSAGGPPGDGAPASRSDVAPGVRGIRRLASRSRRRESRRSPMASSWAARSSAPPERAFRRRSPSRRRCARRSTPRDSPRRQDRAVHQRVGRRRGDHTARDALSRPRRHFAARARHPAADRDRSHRHGGAGRRRDRLSRALLALRQFRRRADQLSRRTRHAHRQIGARPFAARSHGARGGAQAARRPPGTSGVRRGRRRAPSRCADVAYIALGSNLGDRDEHLARARDAIAQLPSSRVVAESSIEETAPLGQLDQPMYLNQMVALETSLTPRQLLEPAAGDRAARGSRAARAVGVANAGPGHRLLRRADGERRRTSRFRIRGWPIDRSGSASSPSSGGEKR